ncbi:hypothetical protein [Chitinophaga sp. CF418]|uniref:hypothetical protein n=1 Tax=Chitinophaga sp. CF418 TaxID=1855287 RepID=UPI000916D23A|nr:hypothetical protein [Chitinophaga sp. CF418]SHN42332.1 hypothetical protein SAMN05216311_114182 [Chitinophaga sp. CF418]
MNLRKGEVLTVILFSLAVLGEVLAIGKILVQDVGASSYSSMCVHERLCIAKLFSDNVITKDKFLITLNIIIPKRLNFYMSVTENGPEGYDYQYLGSLYVILHIWSQRALKAVYIDRLGSEDLTLLIDDPNGHQEIIEAQFKNRSSAFDDDIFNSCINKFSAFKCDSTILSKLQEVSINDFFILTSGVVSGVPSRIHVVARPYTFEKSTGKSNSKDLQLLINDIDKEYSVAQTDTQKKRKKFLENLKQSLTPKTMSDLLQRVTLIDRLTKKEIVSIIGFYLTDHLVPVSAQRHVMLEYLELIKEKRGRGVDVFADLERLIAANTKNLPAPDPNYHLRGDEAGFIEELMRKYVLLLTGVPLCGKTQTAIYTALKVIESNKSIEYYATTDTRAAEQFLYSNEFGARICYLEDPINSDQSGSKSVQYRLLESLVHNLPTSKQRYLIVTAANEDVNHLTNGGYLSGQTWQDLTIEQPSFLSDLWERFSIDRSVPEQISNLTKKLLSGGDYSEKIQPGQLAYLSRNHQRLNTINPEALLHFINFRASTLTESTLKESGEVIEAIIIMAATSNTRNGISDKDLQYFSDDRLDYWPAINHDEERSFRGIIFGAKKTHVYTIREYEDLPPIKAQLEYGLSKLIDYGYLEYRQGHYQFKHPIYREAARTILLPGNPLRFKKAISSLRKSIACLNVNVALQATRNLLFIGSSCKEKVDQQALISIGISGLLSTFVSVRDQSLLFLISQFDDLSQDLQEKVSEEIQKRCQSQFGTYVWQRDTAFIPEVKYIEKEFDRPYRNHNQIYREWKQFCESETQPDSYRAWKIVKSLDQAIRGKKKRIAYDVVALRRFLNYNEGFIRGKAAYLLAASATDNDVKLVKELFAAHDPLVNYQLIKGLFRSWPYFKSPAIKEEMKLFMIRAYDNLFVVLSSVDLFSQFSAGHTQYTFDWMYDIEDNAALDMWYLWGELMPVFFKHLPTSIRINTSRFTMTFKEAQVPDGALIVILDAFINWLQENIKDKGYHSSMADIPIWFFSEKIDIIKGPARLDFIKKFHNIDNKVFQATFWRYIVAQWPKLGSPETSYLRTQIQYLSTLIHSVILTTESIPDELQCEILWTSLTGKTARKIVEQVPSTLLLNSLATLYLLPPFNELPYKNTTVWNTVLAYLLKHPNFEGFDIALTVFFDDVLIMGNNRNGTWNDPKQQLKYLLKTGTELTRKTVFTKLLLDLMGTNTSNAKAYLDILFAHCSEAEMERYSEEAAVNIEAISNSGNLARMPDFLSTAVEKKIVFDLMIFRMIDEKWIENMEAETLEKFGKVIVFALQQNEVKTLEGIDLFRTWARVNVTFFTVEEMEIIESYMARLQERAREQRYTKEDLYQRRFREMAEHY